MRRLLMAVTFAVAMAGPAAAAIPEAPMPQMSVLNRVRDDGAEYVWRVFCNSGLRYNFIPAAQFPASPRFVEVTTPQTGDIAWWPEYVAIFVAQNRSLITETGMVKLADLSSDGSRPRFFRMRVMPDQQPGQPPAAGECERSLF